MWQHLTKLGRDMTSAQLLDIPAGRQFVQHSSIVLMRGSLILKGQHSQDKPGEARPAADWDPELGRCLVTIMCYVSVLAVHASTELWKLWESR